MASRESQDANTIVVSRGYRRSVPARDGIGAWNVARSLQTVAAITIVAIAVITAHQLWLTRQNAIDAAATDLARLDMVFAEQTGRAVETVDLVLRNAADLTPERARANAPEVGDVLRRRIAGVRQILALAVADPAGTIVAASQPELLGPLPPAGMAALSIGRVQADGALRISEPLRNPDGHWTALLTRNVSGRDGRFGGMIVAYLNLAYFEDFYQAVDLADRSSIVLYLRNGTALARFPEKDAVIGTSFADQPPFTKVLAAGLAGTVLMTSPLDGTQRIVAVRALKAFPLAVSVSVAEGQVLASWWNEVWVFSAATLFGGIGLVGVLLYLSRQARETEMAARLRTMQELARVASLDALTGLLNRTTLTERLEQMLAAAAANHTEVALLFLDLDGFKQINDVQGHKAGDAVLRVVAGRIAAAAAQASPPNSTHVSRWGGDEFVIVARVRDPDTADAPSDAVLLAGDILREASRPIDVDGQTVRVGGTIGLATYPQDGLTPDVLVSAADAAMYNGKQCGGNIVRVYDPALADAVAVSASLEADLRQALRDQSLSLVYQPIVEMPGERCAAFEALVRWQHPIRGNIPPIEFIPVTEHSGLIGRLGQWVLDRACVEAAAWPGNHADLADTGPTVCVNVSLAQVISGELQQDVVNALERSGLPANRLQLELTESLVGADHMRIIPVLTAIRGMGVSIALDDFGTGFSSLSRLRHWPINIVKIDKSFVEAMPQDGTAVIRATLLVALEYGLSVTVEGVETVEQWRELTNLGVQSFQGFLFSRPLPAAEVAPWLERVSKSRTPHGRGFGRMKLEDSALLDATAVLTET